MNVVQYKVNYPNMLGPRDVASYPGSFPHTERGNEPGDEATRDVHVLICTPKYM